jgi:carboxylesterase
MGMCMGALLSAVLAQRERHAHGNLVLLAPPVYIDGWATPWYSALRPALYASSTIRNRMKIEEEDPFGIKNEQLRAIVKAKFARGENFHYQWVPLECVYQVDRLRAIVMKSAPSIRCQTLVIHAREDELTSLRSANFLVEKIGGARARMVVLEDSYHMVCVDNDREIVARNVLEFFGAALMGAGSALANEPKMSAQALHDLFASVKAKLASGDWGSLRDIAIPDVTWAQPGDNRVSGVHAGRGFASFAEKTRTSATRFAEFGNPVFNRGVVLVPATMVATTDDRPLQSPGALMMALHAGKLLELRWFPDDVTGEDAFFGPPEAAASGPSDLEKSFETAVAASRTLLKPPDNDTLLALYAFYKQASTGDASGERPGALDMINRAKYDAWTARKGVTRDEAMKSYVALVDKLKSAE